MTSSWKLRTFQALGLPTRSEEHCSLPSFAFYVVTCREARFLRRRPCWSRTLALAAALLLLRIYSADTLDMRRSISARLPSPHSRSLSTTPQRTQIHAVPAPRGPRSSPLSLGKVNRSTFILKHCAPPRRFSTEQPKPQENESLTQSGKPAAPREPLWRRFEG